MDSGNQHSLAELARVTGVTPRTVRYYIAQGLLPGPNDAGKAAWYGEGHLDRLRLIRRLQTQHLPLAEIRSRLGSISDAEVAELVAGPPPAEPPASNASALEYIREVLGTPPPKPERQAFRPMAMQGLPPMPAKSTRPSPLDLPRLRLARGIDPTASLYEASAQPPPAPPNNEPQSNQPSRSQWDRIGLTPDIELHVRRPLSRQDNRRLDRLITIARQVLGEEQP